VKLIVDDDSARLLAEKEYYRYVYKNKEKVNDFIT